MSVLGDALQVELRGRGWKEHAVDEHSVILRRGLQTFVVSRHADCADRAVAAIVAMVADGLDQIRGPAGAISGRVCVDDAGMPRWVAVALDAEGERVLGMMRERDP